MIVVKKEKSGKWIVTRSVKEHNDPLVVTPANGCRTVLLSQAPDEKDVKIRELTAEVQREQKRSAAYQEQLDMVLREFEEHSNHLSRNRRCSPRCERLKRRGWHPKTVKGCSICSADHFFTIPFTCGSQI